LARAAYARSDIIVMDDILSAVDVKVGEHIFRHLICGFLKDRTRVLVTHNLSLVVPKADTVIVVKDMEAIQSRSVEHPEGLMNSLSAYQFVHEDLVTGADVVETPSVAESLIDTEVKQVGSVGLHVYWQYLRACGGWIVGFT
jgi:ABC-type cobalamin/Fe3+-siderophores transport system ATPase subunit